MQRKRHTSFTLYKKKHAKKATTIQRAVKRGVKEYEKTFRWLSAS